MTTSFVDQDIPIFWLSSIHLKKRFVNVGHGEILKPWLDLVSVGTPMNDPVILTLLMII